MWLVGADQTAYLCILIRAFIYKAVYCKVPKFLDARKCCCNLPKIQEKRPNPIRIFRQKDADGLANSADPDQTAPLGAV